VLYTVIREHVETFEAANRTDGTGLPRFVEDEFRTFLRCGGEVCHDDDPAAPTGDGKCPTSMTRLLPRSITSAAHREPGVAWLIEGLPPGHVA
jgi:hypothetical protein